MSLLPLLLWALASPPQPPKETGAAIVRHMESVYSHLQTYSDTGEGAEGIRFKTFYRAPGKLYFEYTEHGETEYFCASGRKGHPAPEPGFPPPDPTPVWVGDAYVLSKVEHDALELLIAGFTGISRGTAYNVPTMIFPAYAGRHFHDLPELRLVRTEKTGGETCYVVASKGDMDMLWISIKTYALRRVEEHDFDPTEVTTYTPVLNGKIDDAVFHFHAPPK